MHPLYMLTPMTGREAAEQRTVIIGTVELNWRLWIILIAASPVALFVTLVFWPFFGQLALIMLPIVLIAAAVLFYQRSTSGLRLRRYQALMDKKKARSGTQLFLCGVPIDTSEAQFRRVMPAAAPYGRADELAAAKPSGKALVETSPLPSPSPERPTRGKRKAPKRQTAPTAPRATAVDTEPQPLAGRSASAPAGPDFTPAPVFAEPITVPTEQFPTGQFPTESRPTGPGYYSARVVDDLGAPTRVAPDDEADGFEDIFDAPTTRTDRRP